MINYIKQVKELDEAIHYTRSAIVNARSILNKTTDYNIAKKETKDDLSFIRKVN